MLIVAEKREIYNTQRFYFLFHIKFHSKKYKRNAVSDLPPPLTRSLLLLLVVGHGGGGGVGAPVRLLADLVEGPGHGDREEEAGGGRHPVDGPCGRHGAQDAEDDLQMMGMKSRDSDLMSVTDLAQLGLEVETKNRFLQVGHSRQEENIEKGSCEAGQDGHHLTGGQGGLVDLHPAEEQEGHHGRHHEAAAFIQSHDLARSLCNPMIC